LNSFEVIQQQLPDQQPEKFCVAPFLSTMQTTYGKTSPCAYGVTEWQLGELTPKERWQAPQLNEFRSTFAQGQVPSQCIKCVNEEQSNKDSLRLRMLSWYPNSYQDFVKSGQWQSGPKHVSTKVSNICNLSCRTCGGWDSNSFAEEGKNYIEKYHTELWSAKTNAMTLHNKFVPLLPPKNTDYEKFNDVDSNITKLEFFGGEPLLNLTHLKFLEHLVDTGKSKNITLFYSTNCTQKINPRHYKIWSKFHALEFSLSIDHIEDKFHYIRWPGNWEEVKDNVKDIINLKHQLSLPVSHVMSPCCSLLNVHDIDEVLNWGREHVGSVYINMIASPDWLTINCAPDDVKQAIVNKIKTPEVLGFIGLKPHNPLHWKQFLIWTKRQDLFRNQDFTKVFPEFYNLIKSHWDSVTDLSESNYYNL